MARRGQNRVSDALQSVLGSLTSATKVRESMAFAYWARVVGPQAAAASTPESVREGVLFVHTKSAVWSQELTFMKATILKELNRHIGRPVLREIVFRAQGVPLVEVLPETPNAPTEEELAGVRLSAEDKKNLRQELARIVTIRDEKLREAVHQRIVRDRRLRVWRLQHGWCSCKRCTALHRTEEPLCPVCRVCQ